jgi:hypothetical protein
MIPLMKPPFTTAEDFGSALDTILDPQAGTSQALLRASEAFE